MLYVSTRNINETYTAYRALHEEYAPDGGFYVPFYLPSFSPEEINKMKTKQSYEIIADILNLFFSLHLSATDMEEALEGSYFACKNISQNLIVAELWHTPEGSIDFILNKINHLLTGNADVPVGWPRVAIEVSLLFGLLGLVSDKARSFDMSVTANDFSDLTAVVFAKAMGFSAKLTTCACDDGSVLWDLANKGECCTGLGADFPYFFELFLHNAAGYQAVRDFVNAAETKKSFYIDINLQEQLNKHIYPAVVSADRAGSIISGMYSSNQYLFDRNTALAYGSLQDYRAIIGANNQTVILAKAKPENTKE